MHEKNSKIMGFKQLSVETALNSSGDVMFAATAEYHDRMKRGEKIDYGSAFE